MSEPVYDAVGEKTADQGCWMAEAKESKAHEFEVTI
jgi:hypothetical protein